MSDKMLRKRENATMQRAKYMQAAGKIIQDFLKSNWKSLQAVTAIVQQSYPDVTNEEVANFWSFKTMNWDLLGKMEIILDKLKQE